MNGSSMAADLNAVYSNEKMRRRYEVWFVRCGLADGSGAWWFRYLIAQQPKATAAIPYRRYFQIWATWFPKDAPPRSFVVAVPTQELQLSAPGRVPFHCRVNGSGIEEGRCWGNVHSAGHNIRWNLRIHSHFGVKLSDKGWIGFSRSPHSDAIFSGEITLDGKKFSGEPLGFGVQGHNCGYRHRTFWHWMHAYFPRPEGASTLEALVYDLPLGMTFRNAIWWHNGVVSRVRRIQELAVVRSGGQLRWNFSGQLNDGSAIVANIDAAEPGIHELPYAKTDGSGSFPVSNASVARAMVTMGSGESVETQTGAVLEMGGL
jgi:hypothetical protein